MDYKKLIEQAKNGDENAITDLYTSAYKRAMYTAKSYIKDASMAEDIVQDSFIKAFSSLDSIQNPDRFSSWVDAIVSRKCLDFLRKGARDSSLLFSQMTVTDDDGNEKMPDWEDDNIEFIPDEKTDADDLKNIVSEIINALPADQRMTIGMFYMDELSISEISAALSVSEGTVKSRLNRAREKLRQMTLDIEKRDGKKLHHIPDAALLGWFYKKSLVSYAAELSDIPVLRSSAGSVSAAVRETVSDAANSLGTASVSGAAVSAGAGIAVKAAAAIIAAVAVGAGVMAVSHFGSTGTADNTNITAENSDNSISETADNEAASGEDNEASGNGNGSSIMLTDEETALLKEAYSYINDTSENSYIAPIYLANRELFYDIYDKLDGRMCIFTGEGFEDGGTGSGVYLKDCNTLYVGALRDGRPEGFGKLARWHWFYDAVTTDDDSQTYILPGIYANEYDGEWTDGKANGDGTSYGNFGTYKASDMDRLNAGQLNFGFRPDKPVFITKSIFANDLADGETERSYADGIHYSFIATDGYTDPDGLPENGRIEEKYGATYYTFDIMNGVNTAYSVKSDYLYKNSCPWDEQFEIPEPLNYDAASVCMDGAANAAMEADLADELSANIPFELVPDFFRRLSEEYGDRLKQDQYYDVLYDDIEYADDHVAVPFEGDDGSFTFTYYYNEKAQ